MESMNWGDSFLQTAQKHSKNYCSIFTLSPRDGLEELNLIQFTDYIIIEAYCKRVVIMTRARHGAICKKRYELERWRWLPRWLKCIQDKTEPSHQPSSLPITPLFIIHEAKMYRLIHNSFLDFLQTLYTKHFTARYCTYPVHFRQVKKIWSSLCILFHTAHKTKLSAPRKIKATFDGWKNVSSTMKNREPSPKSRSITKIASKIWKKKKNRLAHKPN